MSVSEILEKERLTQAEAAKYLKISTQVWYRMKAAKELPTASLHMGKTEYWFKEDLDAWVLKNNPHIEQKLNSEFKGVANA